MLFVAIELLQGGPREETYHDAAKAFIQAAAAEGVRFHRAVVFGPYSVGPRKLIRFQTDCPNYPPVVKRLVESGRGIIAPTKGGYRFFIPGKDAPVSTTQMQLVARPGYGQIYRGPKVPFWERQFAAP